MKGPALVTTILITIGMLSIQLLIGAALWQLVACTTRRRRARAGGGAGGPSRRRATAARSRAAHELRRTLPFAAVVAVVAFAAGNLLHRGVAERIEPLSMLVPGLFTLLGAAATSACFLVLRAGGLEASGRLPSARRLVRLGGRVQFLAIDGMLILFVLALPGLRASRRALQLQADTWTVVEILAAAACLALSGFVGLLAGLSGKPRPSGRFAGLLYVLGMLLLVGSADPS